MASEPRAVATGSRETWDKPETSFSSSGLRDPVATARGTDTPVDCT